MAPDDRSGRQRSSVAGWRSLFLLNVPVCLAGIAMAWILTLPVAMMLSGFLYILFLHLF